MTTETKLKSIYGCVLTNVAPASNYRGETVGTRNVLQKLVLPSKELHTIVSAEAIRNRLREMLRDDLPKNINRSRIINSESDQLTVKFNDLPNRNKFADDMLFGFLMIDRSKKEKVKTGETEKQGDSMLRVNYALSIDSFPHHFNKTMHQSPVASNDSAYKNAGSSVPIEREVHVTAFQYPFGINLNDLRLLPKWDEKDEVATKEKKRWIALLLRAIGELNNVGGGHARTMYPFAPVSIVLRLTHRRAPEFDLYGFKTNVEESQKELIESLKNGLLPAKEFYIGGKIVRENEVLRETLAARKNGEHKNPEKLGKIVNVHPFETSAEAIDAVVRDAGLLADTEIKELNGETQNNERR
ncbi:MAG: type I-B CRISPR-associated protein Cas7/Cst2/DevR [Pyrinomonadaceae bacterium]